jgi:hypothetical protein
MSFSPEVIQFFTLTATQAEQLHNGLNRLQQTFQQAEADVVNTPEFSKRYYQKFQQLALESGITEPQFETLLSHLYGDPRYRAVVNAIVSSFYCAGGDRSIFEEIYQQILSEEQI